MQKTAKDLSQPLYPTESESLQLGYCILQMDKEMDLLLCKAKTKTVILWIYIDIYMNSMSVSPTLEQTLHILSFDSKGNNRIEEIIRIR